MIYPYHYNKLQRLTASSTRRMVLPIFVTLCDAQNRSNNCNSYANAFPIAYISFFWTLKKRPRYKSGPYLTQSVKTVASVCLCVCLFVCLSKLRWNGSAVRVVTDGQMEGRYQTYYLPCFAVDKKYPSWELPKFLSKKKKKGKRNLLPTGCLPLLANYQNVHQTL